MIEIKSTFGHWKEVDRQQAKEFIEIMLNNGANKKYLESNHLRGISIIELLGDKPQPIFLPFPTKGFADKPSTEAKFLSDSLNLKEIKECTVELEALARQQPFVKFMEQIIFSQMVWENDEKVRNNLPPVKDYILDCVNKLQ